MTGSLSSESNWWSENSAIWQQVFKDDWKVFHNNLVKVMLGEMSAEAAAKDYDKAAEAFKAKAQGK
jgi:multiple sugar transport system substrate-binding protein